VVCLTAIGLTVCRREVGTPNYEYATRPPRTPNFDMLSVKYRRCVSLEPSAVLWVLWMDRTVYTFPSLSCDDLTRVGCCAVHHRRCLSMGSMGTSRVAVAGMISGRKVEVEVEVGILTAGNQSGARAGRATDSLPLLVWLLDLFRAGRQSFSAPIINGMDNRLIGFSGPHYCQELWVVGVASLLETMPWGLLQLSTRAQ
jgi:hypothetical protein